MGDGPSNVNDDFRGVNGSIANPLLWSRSTITSGTTYDIQDNKLVFNSSQTSVANNEAYYVSNYALTSEFSISIDIGVVTASTEAAPQRLTLSIENTSTEVASIGYAKDPSNAMWITSIGYYADGWNNTTPYLDTYGTVTLYRDSSDNVYGLFPGSTTPVYINNVSGEVVVKLYAYQNSFFGQGSLAAWFDNFVKVSGSISWPDGLDFRYYEYAVESGWGQNLKYAAAYLPQNSPVYNKASSPLLVRNSFRLPSFGPSYQVFFRSTKNFDLYGYQIEMEIEDD